MPLSVAMPCGFEENLMDFECSGGVAGSWGTSSHTVTDFDHPDPLLMVSLNPKDHQLNTSDGIGAAIAGQFFRFRFPFFLLFCHVLAHFEREKMVVVAFDEEEKCFKWNITNGRRERRGRGESRVPPSLCRCSSGGRGQLNKTRNNQTWMKRVLCGGWFCVVDRWRPCLMKAITCSDVTHTPAIFYPNRTEEKKIKFRWHISYFKGRNIIDRGQGRHFFSFANWGDDHSPLRWVMCCNWLFPYSKVLRKWRRDKMCEY